MAQANAFEIDDLQPVSQRLEYPLLLARTCFSPLALLMCVIMVFSGIQNSVWAGELLYWLIANGCLFWFLQEVVGGARGGIAVVSLFFSSLIMLFIENDSMPLSLILGLFYGIPLFLGLLFSKRRALFLCFSTILFILEDGMYGFLTIHKVLGKLNPMMAGSLLPLACSVFESGGWFAVSRVWMRYHGDASPMALAIIAAHIVTGAATIRLDALLSSATGREDSRQMFLQACSTIISGICLAILKRIEIIKFIWHALSRRCQHTISPESDLILRTHLTFGYPPHLCSLWLIGWTLTGNGHSRRHVLGWVFILINLMGQFIADMSVITYQRCLSTDAASMSLLETWTRLRKAGEHQTHRLCCSRSERERRSPAMFSEHEPLRNFLGISGDHVAGALIVVSYLGFSRPVFEQFLDPLALLWQESHWIGSFFY